jgi:Glycosyl transferase family 11
LQDILDDMQNNVRIRLMAADAFAKQKSSSVADFSFCHGNFVTVNTTRERLGDLMFQTASLLGISKNINRPAVFLKRFHGHNVFSSFWIPHLSGRENTSNCIWNTETSSQQEKFMILKEAGAGTFTPALMDLGSVVEGKPILLTGNLQSWRYFSDIRDHVKHLFTFKRSIYDTAMKIIERKLGTYSLETATESFQPTIVGVHIRRGDFVTNLEGLEPATDVYLLNCLNRLRVKYRQAIFLVASDDPQYCKKLFRHNIKTDVFVLEKFPPEVHMAVLSLAEHIIISTGSFGWWTAYISNAKSVTYYGDYPRNGSVLRSQFPKDDYFPLDWLDGTLSNQFN